MKATRTIDELFGHNESPLAGDYIISSERDFSSKGVTAAVSTLYNMSNGRSATVDTVTSTRIDAAGTQFQPGDLWKVTLAADWVVQDDDGPDVEIQCRRCGWSYPRTELIRDLCITCRDES